MSIRRTRLAFEDQFAQVPNDWMRDKRLSRRARGLLAELLTHRPGWNITIESLVEGGPEGRDAIRSAINELILVGYLVRGDRDRRENGTLGSHDYELREPPAVRDRKPASGEPTSGNPTQADPPLKKTISREDQIQEHHGRKTHLSVRRATAAQLMMIRDLIVMLDLDPDPDRYVQGFGAMTTADADDVIQEYWVMVEHAGRADLAYDIRRDPERYALLGPKGRAFVDREDLTA